MLIYSKQIDTEGFSMNIYDRDYNSLTEQERIEWKRIKKEETVHLGDFTVTQSKFHEYPKAVRHYESLFPNNYLDIMDLQKVDELNKLIEQFSKLLENNHSNERDILSFINENKAYPIIASLLKEYSFGHHDAFIFPEFQLGNSYRVDYLLIGRNSGGHEFIFVELEHPNKKIFLKDGTLGEAFRKGLNQIDDWKRWLEIHFSSLHETFTKYRNPKLSLPEEFLITDRTRYHYVVVAGRRNDFEKNHHITYRLRREAAEKKIQLLHYDNLYDKAKSIVGENNY